MIDIFILALAARMTYEWAKLVSADKLSNSSILMAVTCVFSLILMVLGNGAYALLVLILGIIMTYISGRIDQSKSSIWMAFGTVYITVPLLSFIWIYDYLGDGFNIILYIVGAMIMTDTAAYFGGRLIKGKKLLPSVSPNKTWAGLITGMIFAAIWGGAFAAYYYHDKHITFAILGAVIAAVGQAGDLLESFFKRMFGVKDTGNLLPGHGGVLDRVDGFILVLPLFVWLIHAFPGTIFAPLF